jgi:hypothetical protein
VIVYLRALRKGITYHHLAANERFTKCGQPVSRVQPLPIIRAVDDYAARECKQCNGDAVRVEPLPVGADGKPSSKFRGISRYR